MALHRMKDLLCHAEANHYAVGYFEAFNMDAMLGVLDAAKKARSPVIIGFGGAFLSSGKRMEKEDVYLFGAVAKQAAERSGVPCAVILNEADHEDMIYQGMQAGFNALMYQKPGEDFSDTLRITREICKVAHFIGLDVESEVGVLPTADISTGKRSLGQNTDVDTAKRFVGETGIDALAVSIGNVHLLEGEKACIDYGLLEKLKSSIPVPLVLHGGTGVSAEDLKKAIRMGISKLNVGTVLKREYLNKVREYLNTKDINHIDPHILIGWGGEEDMISCGRAAIAAKTMEFIEILGSAGQADKAAAFHERN